MKILKWIGLGLLGLVLLVTASVVVPPFLPVMKDAASAGPYKRYLEEKAIAFERGDRLGISLPEAITSKRLVMLAEMHGFADAQAIDLAVMEHLRETRGTRVLLAELAPEQAAAFNRMIIDGSDADARLVFDHWAEQSAQWANKEFWAKLEAIAAINQGLGDDEKFVFIGVDQPGHARLYARYVGPTRTTLGGPRVAALRAVNLRILREQGPVDPRDSRYTLIMRNMASALADPALDGESLYGFWGLFHGGKALTNGNAPLARRLNEEGALAGEVATILLACVSDCSNMMPSQALPAQMQGSGDEAYTALPMAFDSAFLMRMRGVGELLGEMDRQDTDVLFVPFEEGNPYSGSERLGTMSGYMTLVFPTFDYEGSAAEAADGFIVHRGSDALTPWAGEVFDIAGTGYDDPSPLQ